MLGLSWPRIPNPGIRQVLATFAQEGSTLDAALKPRGDHQLGYKKIALYYLSIYADEPPAFTLEGEPAEHTATGTLAFDDEDTCEVALALTVGKLGLLWWATQGDDLNVTHGLFQSFPLAPSDLPADSWEQLLKISRRLRAEMVQHPIYTKYAGKWMGNWDIKRVRHITDEADMTILDAFGLGGRWEDLELFYAGFAKATGERPGTVRELPTF